MTKNEQKEVFKILLVILASSVVMISMIIYFEGECMKYCCLKIVFTIMILIALLSGLIAIWCCTPDQTKCPDLSLKSNCAIYYDSGFSIFREIENGYSVIHYENIGDLLSAVSNGDSIFVYEDKINLDEEEIKVFLKRFENTKKITIKFCSKGKKSKIIIVE